MDSFRNGLPPSRRSAGDSPRGQPGMVRIGNSRAPGNLDRAERFEDEKKRIISSCFSVRDEAGKLLQSYITHIRVEEDGAYQSSPPPPGSNPQYKKIRLIILAVKLNGRVLMHKARENDDGTFQIGKTWGLEELQSIESFSNTLPKSPEQQERANWAGSVGFMINMAKPYYWQAKTPKEKEFFIGSLVKIYNKFTSGRLPELIGFNEKDREMIIASTRRSGQSQSQNQSNQQSRNGPYPMLAQSRADNRQLGGRAPQNKDLEVPSLSHTQPRTEGKQDSGIPPDKVLNPADRSLETSDEAARSSFAGRGSISTTDSRAAERLIRPQTRHVSGPRAPQNLRDPQRQSEERRMVDDTAPRPGSQPISITSSALPSSITDRWRTPLSDDHATTNSWRAAQESASPVGPDMQSRSMPPSTEHLANGSPQIIPERRRPPLQIVNGQADGPAQNKIPSPLSEVAPDASLGATLNGPFVEDAALLASDPITQEAPLARDQGQSATAELPGAASPSPLVVRRDHATETATQQGLPNQDTEDTTQVQQFRPGLGPMMGKKVELASKIRKAANAHRAFVPRAGGAGERLLGKVNTSNEPDGVTGVVLPPRSPARELSQSDREYPVKSLLGDNEPEKDRRSSPLTVTVPPLEMTQPGTKPPSPRFIADEVSAPRSDSAKNESELPEESEVSEEAVPRPLFAQRQSKQLERLSVQRKPSPYANALERLGVEAPFDADPRVIAFNHQLDDLGWDNKFFRMKQFSTFQSRLQRDIGKLEAISWLGHTDEGDDRIGQFERSITETVRAVDEIDGLLTLYSVELSVSLIDAISVASSLILPRLCLMTFYTSKLNLTVCKCRPRMKNCCRQHLANC